MDLFNDKMVLKDLALLSRFEALVSGSAAFRAESKGLRTQLKLNGKNSNKLPALDIQLKKLGLPKDEFIQSFTPILRKYPVNVFRS
jgi:hypothetical protein